MRKLFHTTAALSVLLAMSMAANAADVTARPAPYAPPPPVYAPPPFSWTGFYLGGNIGGAWARRDVTDTFFGVNFGSGNNNGVFIGGGQLGYNWQIGYAVLGVEWDIDGAANNNNSGTVFIPGAGTIQVTSNNRNSGWLVGVGIEWAFAPNWSAKVEYNFLGLDDRTFIVPVGFRFLTGDAFIERNRDIQMVKVGINYRFNWSGYGYGYGY